MFGTHASERHAARLVVIVTFLLLGAPERLVVQPVHGESAPIPEDTAPVGVDSGFLSSPIAGSAPGVIFSDVVAVPAAPWVRLRFGNVALAGSASSGDESFLRITSLEDGAVQVLNSEALVRWGNSSAYFNGDRVAVELVAYAGSGDNSVVIDSVTFGIAGGSGGVAGIGCCICGPTDDRVSSNDPRIGRIFPSGCVGFLIDQSSNCLLTAGNCFDVSIPIPESIQFNVPCSDQDGTPNHPSPEHQYPLDPTSFQFENLGPGLDWAYLGAFDNTTTGLSPLAAQGTSFTLATTVPPADGTDVTVTGYGIDFDPPGPDAPYFLNQKSRTQQIDTGAYEEKIGTLLRYFVDTTGGSAGSPVEYLASGEIIGIDTHGGCQNPFIFANQGTAVDHPNLQSAMGNPLGVCAETPDCNENGVPDDQDIAGATSNDDNANGLPDECEPDCNGNGVSDHIDIASGTSTDTNLNRIADECEAKVFVDAAAMGTGNGTSWENAYTDLQAALNHTSASDPCGLGSPVMVSRLWVAEGVYTPASCLGGCDSNSAERADSFVVPSGGSMYGGFPSGGGDGTFGARDPGQFITTLSGDLNADDAAGGDNSENSYHVVSQIGVLLGIVLDGFTITAGNANGPPGPDFVGGGIFMNDGFIANCIIRGNSADNSGGGVIAGGPTTLVNCVISDNLAKAGAGMETGAGIITIANCTFSGNTASIFAGGLRISSAIATTISNSIFWGNTDPNGPTQRAQISVFGNPPTVTFCDIQDCDFGEDGFCFNESDKNIATDPLFAGPNDFRLLSQSPCIDAADGNALPADFSDTDGDADTLEPIPADLSFAVRSVNDPNTPDSGVTGADCTVVDMGAYEFQASCIDGDGNFICDQSEIAQAPLGEDSLGVSCNVDQDCENEAVCLPVLGSFPGRCYVPKNRYISIDRNQLNGATARRVKLDATPNPITIGWVGQPDPVTGLRRLSDTPVYECWGGTVHLGDCEITPNNTYLVQAINEGGDIANENDYSAAISLPTVLVWGDVFGSTVEGSPTPPQGVATFTDASGIVRRFQGFSSAPPLAWADLGPAIGQDSVPDGVANLLDAQLVIKAFQGEAYGGLDPLSCVQPSAPGPPVTITLVPRGVLVQPGDPVEIDAFVDNVSDLAGYQIKLAVSGGTGGGLVLTSVAADTSHPDYVFAARATMEAAHVAGERMGNILIDTGAGVTVTQSKYLTTFSYLPFEGATGVFDFTVVTGEESYLTDTTTKKIEVQSAGSPVVGVGIDCFNDSDCDDKNDCTNDQCAANQCIFGFEPVGTACDDGQFCTTGDKCDIFAACVGGVPPCAKGESCCELTDECLIGNCPSP